jgi:hypothetical protein
MKRIAIVIHFPTYLGNLLPIVDDLEKSDISMDVVVYTNQGFEKHHLARILTRNIHVFDHRLKRIAARNFDTRVKTKFDVFNFVRNANLLFRVIAATIDERRSIRRIRRYLIINDIGVVLFGGLIADHDMNTWIKACRDVLAKTVIHPAWMADAKEPLSIIKSDTSNGLLLKTRFDFVVARWIPKGVISSESNQYFRMPKHILIAKKICGTLQENPWILHSGRQDLTLFECNKHLDLAKKYGFNPVRYEVTGSFMIDQLNSSQIEFQNYWHSSLGNKMPRVLCAIPPNMFSSRSFYVNEFGSYQEFLTEFIKIIDSEFGGNVVYSLHPSSNNSRDFIEEMVGERCSFESISKLLPSCDLYIASVSATIGLALAIGVTVINYDVYQYDYSDYVNEQRVLYASNFSDFKNLISRQISTDKVPDLNWGELDSKSMERIKFRLLIEANSS